MVCFKGIPCQKAGGKEEEKMRKEVEEKIFQSGQVEAVLLTSPANMRYVAGFTGEGYVYLSKEQRVVVTDSRYTIAAKAECQGFSVVEWGKEGYFVQLISCIKKENNLHSLGIEDESMTLSLYRKLQKQLAKDDCSSVELKEMGQKISELRQVKTREEQDILRQAEAIGDRAFAKVLPHLQPGVS